MSWQKPMQSPRHYQEITNYNCEDEEEGALV